MAKTAVSQWSTTRANNSDIDSINIAENCPAGNLNDAVREIMVQVKEQLGDVNVKGTDIASATTTDIGAATGLYVDITGTTTITGFGTTTAGVVRILQFDGALTLTHNATSLILPDAANITTVAGDVAIFVSEGSGNWRCVNYQTAAVVISAEIALVPAAAYGSSATRIVRFSTVETNAGGSDLTLTQSATNGDSITINTSGVYAVACEVEASEADREFGVTLNQSTLTDNITSVAVASQICTASGNQNRRANCSRVLSLSATEVLRVCTDGGTLITGAGDARFSVTRLL